MVVAAVRWEAAAAAVMQMLRPETVVYGADSSERRQVPDPVVPVVVAA